MEGTKQSKIQLVGQSAFINSEKFPNQSYNKIIAPINDLRFISAVLNNTIMLEFNTQMLNGQIENKKTPIYDFYHYQQHLAPQKRASFRELQTFEKKNKMSFPYLMIQNSIGQNNTQNKGDSLTHEAISFMEQYSFEQIGLHFDYPKQQTKKIKINEKTNNAIKQSNKLYESIFPSYSQICSDFEEIIKQKFTLYIQGKYKALKQFNLLSLQQSFDQMIFKALFNQVTYSSQFNRSQSDQSKELQISSTNEQIDLSQQPKYNNFNMSKYFMVLILQLLSKDHLNQLFVEPTLSDSIIKITTEIIKTSKRNLSSKTNFYNHNHFNLLFLKINSSNQQTIQQNKQLFQMHQHIFKIQSLDDQYIQISVNILKEHITRIVLSQLQILENYLISFSIDCLDLDNNLKRDIESKVDYFFRVKRAILQLQKGKIINRF